MGSELFPIISFVSFVSFMFVMGFLWLLNVTTLNSIGYIGGTYAALKMGNIAIVSKFLKKETGKLNLEGRNFVKKLTNIGGRIAFGIICMVPLYYYNYMI